MRKALILTSRCEEGEQVEAKWVGKWYLAMVNKVEDGGKKLKSIYLSMIYIVYTINLSSST